MKKCIYLLLIIPLFFTSCSDENNDNPNKFPTTHEQIATAVENTKLIAVKGGEIIEDAISSAYYANDLIDTKQIVEQIRSIEGVESAEATPSGTGIVVKQVDGTYSNLLIVNQDDERLFIENSNKSASMDMKSVMIVNENHVLPNGNGKALILAPFQSSQKTDLEQITKLFQTAGYSVDVFKNENADFQHFNGDFMNKYDIIFIRTHGKANFRTRGGDLTTILNTGEEISLNKIQSLSEDERKAYAIGLHGGKGYFALSTQWLKMTTTNNFTNSWVFASSCESAMIDLGDSSMSETFLDLGAVGYNGYDESIYTLLATPIAEKMVARFTSGLSFTDAHNEVLNDWGLKAEKWKLRIKEEDSELRKTIDVKLFDSNKKINDPFYLIDPDSVVGFAKVIPEAGPTGTSIVYEVIINEKYVDQVTNIEFDIDNTGEHLKMSKISTSTWQRGGLRAPSADSYPRIDTFTFSAFDSDDNLIGQGSATFSILEGSSAKSARNKNLKYYNEQ